MKSKKFVAGAFAMACLFDGGIAATTPNVAEAQVTSKQCGSCGHTVSIYSQVGQACPYCGKTWGQYRTTGVNPYQYTGPTAAQYQAMREARERQRRQTINAERAERIRSYQERLREFVREQIRLESA